MVSGFKNYFAFILWQLSKQFYFHCAIFFFFWLVVELVKYYLFFLPAEQNEIFYLFVKIIQ